MDNKKFKNTTIVALYLTIVIGGYVIINDAFKPSLKQALSVSYDRNAVVDILQDFYQIREANILMLDDKYQLMSSKWVRNETPHSFIGFLDKLGMTKWEPESSDCDDFSKAYTVHVKSEVRKKIKDASSPAVGEVYYVEDDTRSGHAINIVICLQTSIGPVVYFFEPQTQQFVNLSENEIKSIFFLSI